MGNNESQASFQTELAELEKGSSFSQEELQKLYIDFRKKFPNGKLTKSEFIKEMSAIGGTKQFWEQAYGNLSVDNKGMVSFPQFILGLNFFNSDIKLEDKLIFAFRMLDSDGNEKLDEREVAKLIDLIFSVGSLTEGEKKSQKDFFTSMLAESHDAMMDEAASITMEQWLNSCQKNDKIIKAINSCILYNVNNNQNNINGATTFGHQAAGHGGILKKDNQILKAYTEVEFECYECFKNDPDITPFLPAYYGREACKNETTGLMEYFIVLEDLTAGIEKPCIMDLKMGKITYEPTAPIQKKINLSAVDKVLSTSEALGFRICGIRCYQSDTDSYIVKDKSWGANVRVDSMQTELKVFIQNGITLRFEILEAMLDDLYKIKSFFRKQTKYRFIGSSLLFIYDGASPADTPIVRVKMVDFAHTNILPDDNTIRDDSYLEGVDRIIKYFENIADEVKFARGISHDFKLVYFKSPTFCTQCTNFIWGISSKQGYRCMNTGCEYYAHKKCFKLVPNNCKGKKPLD